MNKAELVAAMAEKTGMKKNDAEKALKAFVCLLNSKQVRH